MEGRLTHLYERTSCKDPKAGKGMKSPTWLQHITGTSLVRQLQLNHVPRCPICWNIRSFTKTELKAFQFFSGQREYCLKRLVKVIIPANLPAKMFSKNPCRYQWGHLWSRNSKGQRAPRAFLKSHPNLGACCSSSFPLRDFLIRKTFKEDVEYCSRSLGKLLAISCWPWSACVYIYISKHIYRQVWSIQNGLTDDRLQAAANARTINHLLERLIKWQL